jgi:hypothetical protein
MVYRASPFTGEEAVAPKRYACPTCGEDFDTPEQADHHSQRQHEPRVRREDDETPEADHPE